MLRRALWLFALLSACSSEPQPHRDAAAPDASAVLDGAASSDAAIAADASPRDAAMTPHCSDAGCFGPIPNAGETVDLLFIVDNSYSMIEEQAALRREFPRLIQKLVSGDHDGDGKPEHTAVRNLHVGVVSSSMGGDPRTIGCGGFGDDGLLQHAGNLAHDPALQCAATYPTFLSYTDGRPPVDQLAHDFGCIASLGTAGCGFEQHLESALKALWPADDPRLSFRSTLDPTYTTGHGNRENAGFVRTAAGGFNSTLGIVVVADEDDCSTANPDIFLSAPADAGNAFTDKPLNLRCFYNPEQLLPLERFLFGFRNLDAAHVVFAGIVGVPVDLVDSAARAKVDFSDESARDAYYDHVLVDTRMKNQLDPASDTGMGAQRLLPACTSMLGKADPARRFVELAKRFGESALVQSICGDSFGPPLDRVVEQIVGPD